MAERKGKKLAVLADGHPRRMADGKNAWRKMSDEQRVDFLQWTIEGGCLEERDGSLWHAFETHEDVSPSDLAHCVVADMVLGWEEE
jgi:hypothetical protein